MRRYLLFGGSVYYAGGGFNDFVDSFDDPQQAVSRVARDPDERYEWWHVVDSAADPPEVIDHSPQEAYR